MGSGVPKKTLTRGHILPDQHRKPSNGGIGDVAKAFRQKAASGLRFAFDITSDAVMRFSNNDGWAIASHIALSILMSLFPFLIFITALAGFFGSKSVADEAVRILLEAWPQSVAEPIAQEIHNVLTQARGGILTIGVILAIYFSSRGVEAVRIALNRAYEAKELRPWWLLRLESIAYVFIGAFTLLTLALFVVFAPLIWAGVVLFLPGLAPLSTVITFLRLLFATLVLLSALILAHKFLPAGQRSLREIAPGIWLTFAMWIGAGVAFGTYLGEFSRSYVSTYAGLASVMIALVFLYWIAAIFILGGELNAAILRAKHEPDAPKV